MVSNAGDSLPGPGQRPGLPLGWIVLSWVVVGLAAYWFASWRGNNTAPAPVTAPAEKTVKAVATPMAPMAEPAPSPATPPQAGVAPRALVSPPALPAQRATTEPAAPVVAAPAPQAAPAANVVKCVVNGVVTFSDEPCSAVAGGSPKTGGSQKVAAGPAPIERKITCEGHEDAIRQIDLQAGTTLNASELEGLALRRKQHRDEQFRMRC